MCCFARLLGNEVVLVWLLVDLLSCFVPDSLMLSQPIPHFRTNMSTLLKSDARIISADGVSHFTK
jgi:hypothetical protein